MSQNNSTKQIDIIKELENQALSIALDNQSAPLSFNLEKFMNFFNIPGFSIAVIDDFKLVWAKGYGVTEANGLVPVTTDTLFQAASISKPVTAMAALHFVEQQLLSLDAAVNSQLKSWHIPENDLTKDHPVTLRHLLTHTAGLNVDGFPGYESPDHLPSVGQILTGEKPANTAPISVQSVPGSSWSYSGGGFTVVQQLLMDITGKSFPDLMHDLVLTKLGMDHSTFSQPPASSFNDLLAHGTYQNGLSVPHGYHLYPEMAAAGLWTTPSDLASLAIEVALSKRGKSNQLLSKEMTEEMLTIQSESLSSFPFGSDEYPDRMGLGFFLGNATRPHIFGHTGGNAGFQSFLVMDSETGKGAVYLSNSEFGFMLGDFIIDLLAKQYNWQNYRKPSRFWIGTWVFLVEALKRKGISFALTQLEALIKSDPETFFLSKTSLITFAYYLIETNKIPDALEVMKLEVQLYSDYWNAFDTLAEIYMMMGNEELAIENFKKSLELNPNNISGLNNLKSLQS